jgi:ssDNA-binding Zn-finger/Zn-ribbon topoisomerase 1
MKPHPRIRKTIKWGGAAVTVLLVGVWIGSCWLYVVWQSEGKFRVVIASGRVGLMTIYDTTIMPEPGWSISTNPYPMWWSLSVSEITNIWIPLWLPLPLCGAGTAIACRLDALARRRARLNLCPNCNYDRAGLAAAAKCPECGSQPA